MKTKNICILKITKKRFGLCCGFRINFDRCELMWFALCFRISSQLVLPKTMAIGQSKGTRYLRTTTYRLQAECSKVFASSLPTQIHSASRLARARPAPILRVKLGQIYSNLNYQNSFEYGQTKLVRPKTLYRLHVLVNGVYFYFLFFYITSSSCAT